MSAQRGDARPGLGDDDAAAFLSAARLDGELLTEAPGFWAGL